MKQETSWEYVWLRSIIQYIQESCKLSPIKDNSKYYMKMKLYALDKLKNDALRVIELSIYRSSFFTFISSRTMVKLQFNKKHQVTI